MKGSVILEAREREFGQSPSGGFVFSPSSGAEAVAKRLWIDLEHHLVKDLRKCMNAEIH